MAGHTTIERIAAAAGHLCSAEDELSAAGYDLWSQELRHLIDIIAAELAWIDERGPRVGVTPS